LILEQEVSWTFRNKPSAEYAQEARDTANCKRASPYDKSKRILLGKIEANSDIGCRNITNVNENTVDGCQNTANPWWCNLIDP
jgi:hypothetical protein